METIRKQASRLREQVAKQQQAVLKQFSGRFGHDSGLVDEAELQCHQKLQMLYGSTRAAKHLQRDIVRGMEAFIAISLKQMEIVKKLAENCCKYGNENQSSGFALARASLDFGTSHILMEKERENLLNTLGDQVFEPLRAMIVGAPLEDARLLTYRYERIRQDVEAQTAEAIRRQLKSKEVGARADYAAKLQNAESKLSELKATLSALGREATAAMIAVETQQQQITFQRLLAMVDAERDYHQSVANILDKLHADMVRAKQNNESMLQSKTTKTNMHSQTVNEDPKSSQCADLLQSTDTETNMHSQTVNEDPKSSQSADLLQSTETETNMHSQTVNEDPKSSQSADLLQSTETETNVHSQTSNEDPKSSLSADIPANGRTTTYFVAEVIHPFDAQANGELSLSVGDYVVVRQVAPNGWSEGECKGKAGWFPSAYIEWRDKAPASKVIEPSMLS
ncbi:SH3 domain-containing protein 1-like isoform X2 [Phoenix dactylifera]|uniref:SH3 domain-containing protein 1-like isoform X2 n=1 Tax=Phoenix dactylifera TaxID=42345 RepID=A0A8B9A887_PHODC|nr:SH3 domain-containing protein 1-like isoform X2 [Phoenix dactylifera]